MMEPANPNFPDNLAIQPSFRPTNSDADIGRDDVFDAEAQRAAISKYGIAGRVWDAAYLLVTYFETGSLSSVDVEFSPPCSLTNKDSGFSLRKVVVELGSGTGYVGLKLFEEMKACGPCTMVLTDLPDVCPLLEENYRALKCHWADDIKSSESTCRVFPLPWGDAEHAERLLDDISLKPSCPLTHILCSDLVYFPELLAPLLRSLLHLTSLAFSTANYSPEVIISYKVRSMAKESPFWSAFGLWFSFSPVLVKYLGLPPSDAVESHAHEQSTPWRRYGSAEDSEDMSFVFVAYRRPESYVWIVPEDNDELLNGVGANDTLTRKSSDTFEMLLLMSMSNLEE